MAGFVKFVILLSAVFGISVCAPTPTVNPLQVTQQLYRSLCLEMRELRLVQKQVYDSYRVNRFDSDMYISHYDVEGIPNLSNISNEDRFFMSEMDILAMHSSNLGAFQQLMFFIKMDENLSSAVPDFSSEFNIIEARLARVRAGILVVMSHLNFLQDGVPENVPVSMAPESHAALRNIRDLFVLQEMYSYIAVAGYDLNRRMTLHMRSSNPTA